MKLQKMKKRFDQVSQPGKWIQRQNTKPRPYGYAWQQARLQWLADQPCCAMCGRLATVVDHIQPHDGDPLLFWDRGNWQSLCKPCHDSDKQRLDNASRYR